MRCRRNRESKENREKYPTSICVPSVSLMIG
jgi:hypothetical protein